MIAIQQPSSLLPPAAADCAAGVRLKSKDKGPSIKNRSEQSIYPTQKSVQRTEATPHTTDQTLILRLSGAVPEEIDPPSIKDTLEAVVLRQRAGSPSLKGISSRSVNVDASACCISY